MTMVVVALARNTPSVARYESITTAPAPLLLMTVATSPASPGSASGATANPARATTASAASPPATRNSESIPTLFNAVASERQRRMCPRPTPAPPSVTMSSDIISGTGSTQR